LILRRRQNKLSGGEGHLFPPNLWRKKGDNLRKHEKKKEPVGCRHRVGRGCEKARGREEWRLSVESMEPHIKGKKRNCAEPLPQKIGRKRDGTNRKKGLPPVAFNRDIMVRKEEQTVA